MSNRYDRIQSQAYYKKVLAHFVFHKLIFSDGVEPVESRVSLKEVFMASEGEFRILELLPGIIINAPQILDFAPADIPEDLTAKTMLTGPQCA